jgi:hypothetical protein
MGVLQFPFITVLDYQIAIPADPDSQKSKNIKSQYRPISNKGLKNVPEYLTEEIEFSRDSNLEFVDFLVTRMFFWSVCEVLNKPK